MSNPFDKQASTPSLSFSQRDEFGQLQSKPIGTRLGGVVKKSPEIVQSRGYEGPLKGKPLFWDSDGKGKQTDAATTSDGRSNNPVTQIVVTLTCADGEERSLWVAMYPKDMFEAVQVALTLPDGNVRAIETGDSLFVTLTGKRAVPGKNPAHTYSAEFTKGAGAFAAPPPPPPAGQQATLPPPTPSVAAEPVLSNGFTASALRAAQWTEDQISALSVSGVIAAPVAAPAPAPVPVASPVPPAEASAAPVDDVAAARQAKLDAMPEADRRLLGL